MLHALRSIFRPTVVLAVVLAAALALAGVAAAFGPDDVTVRGEGTIEDRIHIRTHPQDATDVVQADVRVVAGDAIPWHTHPGPVLAIVDGDPGAELTLYYEDDRDCDGTTYHVGEGFVERGEKIHTARNHSDADVLVRATFVVPEDERPLTVLEEDFTRCGF